MLWPSESTVHRQCTQWAGFFVRTTFISGHEQKLQAHKKAQRSPNRLPLLCTYPDSTVHEMEREETIDFLTCMYHTRTTDVNKGSRCAHSLVGKYLLFDSCFLSRLPATSDILFLFFSSALYVVMKHRRISRFPPHRGGSCLLFLEAYLLPDVMNKCGNGKMT